MSKLRVAVLVGSLRKESVTRKVANALLALAPNTLDCSIIEIGDLPLYNEDLEGEKPPAAWSRFDRKSEAGTPFFPHAGI
jgi:chromate reductase